MLITILLFSLALQTAPAPTARQIEARILQFEDERDLGDGELEALLAHHEARVRSRAALAIGRIGDRRGTAALIALLARERDAAVREMAAFALGEIEDADAALPLLAIVDPTASDGAPIRLVARAIEALGKIAALPDQAKQLGPGTIERINDAITRHLIPLPAGSLDADQQLKARLAVTAVMRLRSPRAIDPLIALLRASDAVIRADAANALARLRLEIPAAVPELIVALGDRDPSVRANAARALGASRDPRAVDPLILRLEDGHEWARVGAVRALGALNDRRAVEGLLRAGRSDLEEYRRERRRGVAHPSAATSLLEIASALGVLGDERALPFLREIRHETGAGAHPEIELALARFGEAIFEGEISGGGDWRRVANLAQGLGAHGSARARAVLLAFHQQTALDRRARPEILRALAKTKGDDLTPLLREQLASADAPTREAAASLLGLKPEPPSRVAPARERDFYRRVSAGARRRMTAVIETEKGTIRIELLPEEAPLTVENFASLARRGFYDGVAFHRVVANFVAQGGDPRGDGEGGPGYRIRCEINPLPYERGTLGMALAGKDTGGSQFFLTHSRQPHLDGGYPVFGRLRAGFGVLDRLARGDRIRRLRVIASPPRQ